MRSPSFGCDAAPGGEDEAGVRRLRCRSRLHRVEPPAISAAAASRSPRTRVHARQWTSATGSTAERAGLAGHAEARAESDLDQPRRPTASNTAYRRPDSHSQRSPSVTIGELLVPECAGPQSRGRRRAGVGRSVNSAMRCRRAGGRSIRDRLRCRRRTARRLRHLRAHRGAPCRDRRACRRRSPRGRCHAPWRSIERLEPCARRRAAAADRHCPGSSANAIWARSRSIRARCSSSSGAELGGREQLRAPRRTPRLQLGLRGGERARLLASRGSGVKLGARSRNAAAPQRPPRLARVGRALELGRYGLVGPAAACARCHARRSGSRCGSVASASARCTFWRSSADAAR